LQPPECVAIFRLDCLPGIIGARDRTTGSLAVPLRLPKMASEAVAKDVWRERPAHDLGAGRLAPKATCV